MKPKFIILSLIILFLVIPFISSDLNFKYNNPNKPQVKIEDTTVTSGDNSSFNQSLISTLFLNLSGTNADRNINIDPYNLSLGTLLADNIDLAIDAYGFVNVTGQLQVSSGNGRIVSTNSAGSAVMKTEAGQAGSISFGNTADIGISQDGVIGTHDYDGAFIFKQKASNPDDHVEFIFIEESGDWRFALPSSGANHGTYNPRSMIIAGPSINNESATHCSVWGFDKIDCDTGGTGADLGVQDDLQVLGAGYIPNYLNTSELPSSYLQLSGNNADQNININSYDFTTTGAGNFSQINLESAVVDMFNMRSNSEINFNFMAYGASSFPIFESLRARGNMASPSAVLSGDELFIINANGQYSGAGASTGGQILVTANENWDATNRGSKIEIKGISDGTTSLTNWLKLENSDTYIYGDLCNSTDCYTMEDLINDSNTDTIPDYTNIAYVNETNLFAEPNNFTNVTFMTNAHMTKFAQNKNNFSGWIIRDFNDVDNFIQLGFDNRGNAIIQSDNNLYFSASGGSPFNVNANQMSLANNKFIRFGSRTNDYGTIGFSTYVTNYSLWIGVSGIAAGWDSKRAYLGDNDDYNFNYGHPNSDYPILYFLSGNKVTDEWASFGHDGTNAIMNVSGSGAFSVFNASGLGAVRATDYLTSSKVPDVKDGQKALDKLNNIDKWIKADGKIDYDKHYAYTPVEVTDRSVVDFREVDAVICDERGICHNGTKQERFYPNKKIEPALSMETRIAELEKMVYELKLKVEDLENAKV